MWAEQRLGLGYTMGEGETQNWAKNGILVHKVREMVKNIPVPNWDEKNHQNQRLFYTEDTENQKRSLKRLL